MYNQIKKQRKVWRRADKSHPYIEKKEQIDFTSYPKSESEPRRYIKRVSFNQKDPKDNELETVMIGIHEYFMDNPDEADGAAKSDLCTYVMTKYPSVTVSKFRFALGNAIRLKLVNVIFAENCIRRTRRSSGDAKITIPDEEDCGIPDRVHLTKNGMDEELKRVANNLHRKSKVFAVKDLKCFYCNKLFFNGRGLRQHCMQSHYKAFGYSFKCDVCIHKFKTWHGLEYHKRMLHNE